MKHKLLYDPCHAGTYIFFQINAPNCTDTTSRVERFILVARNIEGEAYQTAACGYSCLWHTCQYSNHNPYFQPYQYLHLCFVLFFSPYITPCIVVTKRKNMHRAQNHTPYPWIILLLLLTYFNIESFHWGGGLAFHTFRIWGDFFCHSASVKEPVKNLLWFLHLGCLYIRIFCLECITVTLTGHHTVAYFNLMVSFILSLKNCLILGKPQSSLCLCVRYRGGQYNR